MHESPRDIVTNTDAAITGAAFTAHAVFQQLDGIASSIVLYGAAAAVLWRAAVACQRAWVWWRSRS